MNGLGLGGYESSDDDEIETVVVPPVPAPGPGPGPAALAPAPALAPAAAKTTTTTTTTASLPTAAKVVDEAAAHPVREERESETGNAKEAVARPLLEHVQPTAHSSSSVPIGPAQGPAAMPRDQDLLVDESSLLLLEDPDQPPASPYTANRLLLRNLTMPPIPNFDIPPSPPGTPPPATTAKFARFLDLKKKGVHFNERLNQSSALRNPGLLSKLMEFAGVSQEDQYASSLPEHLAVATKFPEWAYGDKLVKEHERIAKRKEEEKAKAQREAIDFVPAKAVDGSSSSSRSTVVMPNAGRAGGDRNVRGRGDRPEHRKSRFDERERGGHDGRGVRDRREDARGSNRRRSRSPR